MTYLKMLSKLGIGSAHPGGFSATLKQLQHFRIEKGSSILEVGCGTGRTACFLTQNGYHVTAMDIDSDMLQKAKRRSEAQGLKVDFVQGDVCAMPFEDNRFDVILAESVTNFVDTDTALHEYNRVLKPGGVLYDREIVQAKPIPSQIKDELFDFLGIKQLLSLDEWTARLNKLGFQDVSYWDYSNLAENDLDDQGKYPDDFQYPDHNIFTDFQTLQTAFQYNEMIWRYKAYLGSALLLGTKKS
jgi:ubiquinone/menaquinone biosynthesis C-methylase UbiE